MSESQARLYQINDEYPTGGKSEIVPNCEQLLADHLDLANELKAFFADHDQMQDLAEQPGEAETIPPKAQQAADAATLPPTEPKASSEPGTTVRYFGDCELLEEIARGGMGVVYKARHDLHWG